MLTLKDSQLLPNVRSVSSTLNNSALCPLEGGSGGVWGSRPHTLSRHSPMGPCGRYVGGSWGIRRNIGTRVQARVRCKSWGGRNFFSFQRHPFGMDNLFSLRGVTFTKMREGWSDRNFKTPFNQGGGASAQTLRNRCRNLLRRREPTHPNPLIANSSRTHR